MTICLKVDIEKGSPAQYVGIPAHKWDMHPEHPEFGFYELQTTTATTIALRHFIGALSIEQQVTLLENISAKALAVHTKKHNGLVIAVPAVQPFEFTMTFPDGHALHSKNCNLEYVIELVQGTRETGTRHSDGKLSEPFEPASMTVRITIKGETTEVYNEKVI